VNKAKTETRLVEVKLALARKYDRLAKLARSATKRKTLLNHAAKFHRQVADLTKS
jgi:hypothetical protein